MEYLNERGTNITDKMESGQTLFCKTLQEARICAKELGSYYYDVYTEHETKGKIHIGYGVPK